MTPRVVDGVAGPAPSRPADAGFLLLCLWLIIGALARPTLSASFSSLALSDRQIAVVVAAAAAGLLAVAAAAWGRRRDGSEAGVDVSVLLCGAVVGLYLCVPETGLLRLLILPTVVVAVMIWLRVLGPFGVAATVAIAGLLAWIIIADAAFRGSSWVAATACVSTAVLAPLAFDFGETRPLVRLVVYASAIVCCSRVAGGQPSAVAAMVGACLILAAAVVILRMTPMFGRPQ